jgi:hypothetical protein
MAVIMGARYGAVELPNRDVGLFHATRPERVLVRLRGRQARELWAKLQAASRSPKDVDAAILPHLSPEPLP